MIIGSATAYSGSKQSARAMSRSSFLKRAPLEAGAVAAIFFPTAAHAITTANFDHEWVNVVAQSKPKPTPSTYDSAAIAKKAEAGAAAATRAVKQQTKTLTRDAKAVAYDAQSAGRSAEREFKTAAKDPASYANKATKMMTRDAKAAAYDAKSAGRSAEREFKTAAKDPASYAEKATKKVTRFAENEMNSVTRDAKKLAKRLETETKGVF